MLLRVYYFTPLHLFFIEREKHIQCYLLFPLLYNKLYVHMFVLCVYIYIYTRAPVCLAKRIDNKYELNTYQDRLIL